MVLGVIGLFSADAIYESWMEWNPIIANEAEVLGSWSDGYSTIVLKADHTLDFTVSNVSATGVWALEDFNFTVTINGHKTKMRFIRHRGNLRLMTNPPVDPDMWAGELGMVRN